MKNKLKIKYYQIAPCGMNCGICLGYLRDKNKCLSCRKEDLNKSPYCFRCIIRKCKNLKEKDSKYCFECSEYPCRRMKQLDKRYRTRYGMSMIENLAYIEKFGIRKFVEKENKRWKCKKCQGLICVHRGYCLSCENKK
jgi:hypothetical protein